MRAAVQASWEDLVTAATIGIDPATPLPPSVAAWLAAPGEGGRGDDATSGPAAALTAAALQHACRRGGLGPGALAGPLGHATPYPTAPEHPEPDRRLLSLSVAERIVAHDPEVAAELADQAAAARWAVPPEALVLWLSLASRNVAFARAAGPVVGPRGRWLAAANPAWRTASAVGPVTAAEDPADELAAWPGPWERAVASAAFAHVEGRMRTAPPDGVDQRAARLLALRAEPEWLRPRLADVLALTPGHSRWRPVLVVAADLADLRHRLGQEPP